MTRPVFLITLGAVAGAVVGMVNAGGDLSRTIVETVVDRGAAILRIGDFKVASPAPPAEVADSSHFVFSTCLSKTGENVEGTLRNLLEFHEHDSTLRLVNCLLAGSPQRFCTPDGRRQAADAMEIYLWSRDDARRSSPAHGLADRIHWLDRAGKADDNGQPVDPFVMTWSGPDDRAVFDKLKGLVKDGWLDASAFGFSGRAELREAVRGVAASASPCAPIARGD